MMKTIIKTPHKKAPKWFYVVTVSLPIVCLIGTEILLRTFNYGFDFNQWVDAGEGKYIINPVMGKKYFTSGEFYPQTIEDVFDQQKKANSFRVFVLGESSTEGFPYRPMGSFSRYIRRRLELVYPNTTVEVVNVGMTAINSYSLLDLVPGVLSQKPDLILIYTGHNEYYGAFGVGSVTSYGSSRTLINLMIDLNKFRTTQLIRNSIHWIASLFVSEQNKFSGTLMSNMAKDKLILLDSKVFNAGLQQFKENFTDILHLIKDKGVPVIVCRVASNLKDQKPFISVNMPDYKNADQVFEEARNELRKNHITKADSLFRLAKELDVLRFRAPERINTIIDDLGKDFHVATIPIDSIFDSVSPEGIVGSNLIVDQLHPNVRGHQLIGRAFYDSMENLGYLPKTEKAKIPFDQQDSLTRANFVFTKLDSVIGNDMIILLKNNWPYTTKNQVVSEFKHKEFMELFQPKDFVDSIAMQRIEGMSWVDAHLLAATAYLRRDDIINYLSHINILIYQYPNLRDFDSALKYFYKANKIDTADYTTKRVGIITLYRGYFDDAIEFLTECSHSEPKDPSVFYYLSVAYSKKNDFQSALTMINTCLLMDSHYPEANTLKRQIVKQLKIN